VRLQALFLGFVYAFLVLCTHLLFVRKVSVVVPGVAHFPCYALLYVADGGSLVSVGVMSYADCLELQAMKKYDPTMSLTDLAFIFEISAETTRRVLRGTHSNSLGDKIPNPRSEYIRVVTPPKDASKRGRGRPVEDVDTRFWNKVLKKGAADCWVWQASFLSAGYGAFTDKKKTIRAHHYAWQLAYGAIPVGSSVIHTCNNRACCNPEHLQLKGKYD